MPRAKPLGNVTRRDRAAADLQFVGMKQRDAVLLSERRMIREVLVDGDDLPLFQALPL